MSNPSLDSAHFNDKLVLRGIHVTLTDALRTSVQHKVERLFRHEPQIVRIRVDIEHDKTKAIGHNFIAKGHIEISGPDLIASEASEDAYKSIALLVDKLGEMLRRRADTFHSNKRHATRDERDAGASQA